MDQIIWFEESIMKASQPNSKQERIGTEGIWMDIDTQNGPLILNLGFILHEFYFLFIYIFINYTLVFSLYKSQWFWTILIFFILFYFIFFFHLTLHLFPILSFLFHLTFFDLHNPGFKQKEMTIFSKIKIKNRKTKNKKGKRKSK